MPKQSFAEQVGFTLIEITMVLLLLGILAAVAVPKFFDLHEEAEQKAVLASAAEVQSRLDATFGAKVLEGLSCSDARTFAADISHLADDGEKSFGKFSFKAEGDVRSGTLSLKYNLGDDVWKDVAGFSLVMPKCSDDSPLGYSAAGREAFNVFFSNSYGSGYTIEDSNYKYTVSKGSDGQVTMRITDKTKEDNYTLHIKKSEGSQYIQSMKIVENENHYPTWGKDLQRDDLQGTETAAKRNQSVDIFVSHCPNFDDLFTIKTRISTNGEKYKVIKPKLVSSL